MFKIYEFGKRKHYNRVFVKRSFDRNIQLYADWLPIIINVCTKKHGKGRILTSLTIFFTDKSV